MSDCNEKPLFPDTSEADLIAMLDKLGEVDIEAEMNKFGEIDFVALFDDVNGGGHV